jgi:hypothetical protein
MRIAFAIKYLRQSNYETVAYSIAGILVALDVFPMLLAFQTGGAGIRIIENLSNLAGMIAGLFLAHRSIRQARLQKPDWGSNFMPGALVFVFMIGTFAYTIVAIWAASAGLSLYLGTGWAIGTILVSMFFRFSPPIVVGAFLGAMNVWGWHWALALLFAAPGLAFVVPGVIAAILSALPWRRAA